MFFLNFFDSRFIIFSILAWLFLLFTTLYSVYVANLKQKIGLYYFFAGFTLSMLIPLLEQNAIYFYSHAVSVKIFVFLEMLFVIISSLLLITSASYILFNRPLKAHMLFAFITLSVIMVIYAIFVANNAYLIANIRQVLPLISMIYVMLGYAFSYNSWRYLGHISALISVFGIISIMAYPLFFENAYLGYLPLLMMCSLGVSYILMANDTLKNEIKQMKKAEQTMIANIENIIKSSPFPIILSRLGDDTLMMANNNALKLFGLNESEISRYHFKDFFVDVENRKLLTERLEHNREVNDFEILVKTIAGNTPFWLLLSANVIEYNNDVVLYSAFQDITMRKRHESVLQSQADRDPLTSIYNRRFFETKVAQKIKDAHLAKKPFAIFMLDADKFKTINDKYGHKIGDKVLMELASVCERSLRQDDVIARYGGEEFVAFIDNVDTNTALMVANRLRKAVEDIIVYSDDKIPVSFSVSIGVAPSGISDNVAIMIKMADDAMYLAKQNGRNRVELYDKEKINKLSMQEHQNKKSQIHPVFYDEETKEISLLDGVETSSMIED